MTSGIKDAAKKFIVGAGLGLGTFFASGAELPANPLKAFEPTVGADGPEVKGAPIDNVIGYGPKGP